MAGSKRIQFDDEFGLVCGDATLQDGMNGDIAQLLHPTHATPCIYAWTLRIDETQPAERLLYIGKTRSLRRRVREYLQPFQPHSPNDYKLQVFQRQALTVFPQSRLLLYAKPELVAMLTASEKRLIDWFDPPLNRRTTVPDSVRTEFQVSFEKFYLAGLAGVLSAAP